MAAGTRTDWRREPTARDLRAAERETPTLLAEFAALYLHELPELATESQRARTTHDRHRADQLDQRIDDAWDAIGHLALGT